MTSGNDVSFWMPYALASVLAFLGTTLDLIDRWKGRPSRTFLPQATAFGLLNAAGAMLLYNFGGQIDSLKEVQSAMLRALIVGISYQIIIRSRLTTIGKQPIGVEWFGLVMGLGFVLSFGYWCTDFLVVQRAMAADSMTAARRTPLIEFRFLSSVFAPSSV